MAPPPPGPVPSRACPPLAGHTGTMWTRDLRPDLARIERKLDVILAHLGIPDPVTVGVTPEIVELVREGHEIEAIKRYRERTGEGLREAKAAIDAVARDQRSS